MYWISIITSIAIPLVLSLALHPLVLYIAHKNNWYDTEDEIKIHTGAIPRLGGVAVFLSFFIGITVSVFILNISLIDQLTLGIISGFIVIHIVGLLDDFYNIRAIGKLIGQIVAAILVILSGFVIKTINIPIVNYAVQIKILTYLLTALWIIGITNAVNLIDGMDGFAGSIAAAALIVYAVLALVQGQIALSVICLSLTGSVIGFLLFNFPPAKIFMGDSGSLFLGFAVAVIPFLTANGTITSDVLIVPITVLIIPIVDTFSAIARRINRKVPFYKPDKLHVHHLLLDLGLNNRQIVIIVGMYTIITSLIVIAARQYFSNIYIYVAVVLWILGFLFYFMLFKMHRKNCA